MTALEYAVCVDGVEVTREGAEAWPEGDPLRETALTLLEDSLEWGVTREGSLIFPLTTVMASDDDPVGDVRARLIVAAAGSLKQADPDALVTICVWPADV